MKSTLNCNRNVLKTDMTCHLLKWKLWLVHRLDIYFDILYYCYDLSSVPGWSHETLSVFWLSVGLKLPDWIQCTIYIILYNQEKWTNCIPHIIVILKIKSSTNYENLFYVRKILKKGKRFQVKIKFLNVTIFVSSYLPAVIFRIFINGIGHNIIYSWCIKMFNRLY